MVLCLTSSLKDEALMLLCMVPPPEYWGADMTSMRVCSVFLNVSHAFWAVMSVFLSSGFRSASNLL